MYSTFRATGHTDAELIASVRAGSASAYAELWERYRRAGYVAVRGISNAADVEDVVLEAYTRILEVIRAGKGPTDKFRPYLYQVIRSVIYAEPPSQLEPLDDLPERLTPTVDNPSFDTRTDRNIARVALDHVPEKYRDPLWLLEVEGLPPREAGRLLGKSAQEISVLGSRGRKALRRAWVELQVANSGLPEACAKARVPKLLIAEATGSLREGQRRYITEHTKVCKSCAGAVVETRHLVSLVGSNFVLAVFLLSAGNLAQEQIRNLLASAGSFITEDATRGAAAVAERTQGAAHRGDSAGRKMPVAQTTKIAGSTLRVVASAAALSGAVVVASLGVMLSLGGGAGPSPAESQPLKQSATQGDDTEATAEEKSVVRDNSRVDSAENPSAEKPRAEEGSSPQGSAGPGNPPAGARPDVPASPDAPGAPGSPVQPEQAPSISAPKEPAPKEPEVVAVVQPTLTGACAVMGEGTMTVRGGLSGPGRVQVAPNPDNLAVLSDAAANTSGGWETGVMQSHGAYVALRTMTSEGVAGNWQRIGLQRCS